MLELCRTRSYRRQSLCDSFFPLGNVFAHKYSENAFSLNCTCYHLSGHTVAREEGKQAGLLSGTGVPLAGEGAESSILCWAGTGVSVALPLVLKHLISVFTWCQQDPRNRVWSVYHHLTVNSAFQLNSANSTFKI